MKLLSSSSSKACEYRGERGLVDRPRPGDPLRAVDEAMRAGVAGDSTGGAVNETSLGHPLSSHVRSGCSRAVQKANRR